MSSMELDANMVLGREEKENDASAAAPSDKPAKKTAEKGKQNSAPSQIHLLNSTSFVGEVKKAVQISHDALIKHMESLKQQIVQEVTASVLQEINPRLFTMEENIARILDKVNAPANNNAELDDDDNDSNPSGDEEEEHDEDMAPVVPPANAVENRAPPERRQQMQQQQNGRPERGRGGGGRGFVQAHNSRMFYLLRQLEREQERRFNRPYYDRRQDNNRRNAYMDGNGNERRRDDRRMDGRRH